VLIKECNFSSYIKNNKEMNLEQIIEQIKDISTFYGPKLIGAIII